MRKSSRQFLLGMGRSMLGFVIFVLIVFLAFSVSPIYNFTRPEPFSGPDIFNPYEKLDTAIGWKRANFHTHTRVKGPLPPNECKYWPGEVLEDYRKLGYDILTFSNHNEITQHPTDPSLQVNVYEHGYGLYKYHKLVFGASRVHYFDHLLPLLASQKQWQLDYLAKDSDFIQMNHPFRTGGTSEYQMGVLEGYQIMELDSGVSIENEYWDWALSAGHYSFGLANDDCHDSKTSGRIAVRCNWLNAGGAGYTDIKDCLLGGAYYSMRVPDFGDGDWDIKYEGNRNLPMVSDIGLDSATVYIKLTKPAKYIKVVGQNHATLDSLSATSSAAYTMQPDDAYARFMACFDDGVVIYSNPFARYDKEKAPSPFRAPEHSVNIPLTIAYNALLALLAILLALKLFNLFRTKAGTLGNH